MRPMRTRLLAVPVTLVALAWAAIAAAAPARAETLDEYAVKLGELKARVNLWIKLAGRDPAADKVDRYIRQTEDDFKKKDKGHVDAKDLVAIVLTAKSELFEVRKAAAQALQEAATKDLDPELKGPRKPGENSKRGKFAQDNLIRPLTDKKLDVHARRFVHEILISWFGNGRGRNQSAIANFKPDDEKTWVAAANAWKEIVREG